jgi:hypothetical protein
MNGWAILKQTHGLAELDKGPFQQWAAVDSPLNFGFFGINLPR